MGDEDKGDVARMMFYMATRYEGGGNEPDLELVDYVNSAPNNEPYYGKLTTLLEWHIQDPVDDWEITRNNIIYYNYQGNRNPFIDHPDFVNAVWIGLQPEPSNYPENFSAHNIELEWTDPVTGVLPTANLVLMSDVGFEAIEIPVDNVAVPDSQNALNIDYGIQQCTFTNLTPSTMYYFKIFPYTIDGDYINYKTDGGGIQTMMMTGQ
ncbi:MAG: endonuclease [Bacteroidales bacterium]|nr:endonuclease [Bacteroidales bacterium]